MHHSLFKVMLFVVGAVLFNYPQLASSSDRAHSSRNALDWAGEYTGTIPCADCEGIKVRIVLDQNDTFTRSMEYLGRKGGILRDTGKISWDRTGGIIQIKDTRYRVGENVLIQLNQSGKPITGNLSSQYNLSKVRAQRGDIVEKYWKLIRLNNTTIPKNDWREPHIILKNDNRIIGNGGCNGMRGQFMISHGNRIKISKLASTFMYCDGVMQLEKEFMSSLENINNYRMRGEHLQMRQGSIVRAEFEAVYLR